MNVIILSSSSVNHLKFLNKVKQVFKIHVIAYIHAKFSTLVKQFTIINSNHRIND